MISRVAATVVPLAIILAVVAANEQAPSPPPYVAGKYEGELLRLQREGINDEVRAKITQLWTVWMSDEKGQPARAITGAAQARRTYTASMQEIDRREENLRSTRP